ncbi:MAG TPA: flagellar hook assembly protein FlgD [Desulfuromonadales bacterium]|nr:flagellar hook assembly protein FlgD [Desulfuromonadales bacterium]
MSTVTAANAAATTSTTTAAAAMKKSMGMNKDDFMKLFIAQLQYQDPLAPQDPTAMLNQLSQLSLVEQSYNSNTALEKLLTAQNNNLSISAVSFIGKDITANGNAITLDGASAATVKFSNTVATDSTLISIKDAAGNLVRTITTGALKSGDSSYSWDGRDNNGAQLPAGSYSFSATGTTAGGTSTIASTYTTGRVDGVSMASGTPVLTIGSTSIALTDVIGIKGV